MAGPAICQYKPWPSPRTLRAGQNHQKENARAEKEKEKSFTQIEPENQNSKTHKEANAMKAHHFF